MVEDQELKHVCKFCNKSFPCGRSLGGHMRSHLINSADQTDEKLNKKKLSSVNTGGSNAKADMSTDGGTQTGYGLRENPKKTCKFADSSEDTLLHGRFCKVCGKVFQSWKALFGHMKCHSDRVSNSVEEDSWTSANHKLVMDSQSDNEAAAPNRRKRSKRVTRYMSTTTSSSFSIANASSSVSEIEQEQEDVAMCLMMLSRDVGHWGGLNSVADSSDNNSEFLEARSFTKIEGKNSLCAGGEVVKFKKLRNGKLESTVLVSENSQLDVKQSEYGASGISCNGSKRNKSEVKINGFHGNDKLKKSKVEESEGELGKNLINETGFDHAELGSKKCSSSKRKCRNLFDPELGVESSKKSTFGACEKKNIFECTTCNKTFHSYQALGGHRASHKKTKGCFASKNDSSENSIETEISPDPTADSKLIKSFDENPIDHELVAGYADNGHTGCVSKKSKGHECPICFKVFSSGQALGGHKRSHLIGGAEARNNQTIAVQKPIPEIRDLLDLNLPAPVEEESNGHVGFKPCKDSRVYRFINSLPYLKCLLRVLTGVRQTLKEYGFPEVLGFIQIQARKSVGLAISLSQLNLYYKVNLATITLERKMSRSSSSSGSNNSFDIEELLQIGTRCRELRKEKDMLRDSQSQSFELIRRMGLHAKTLSEVHTEDKKRIQELERELRNCYQEIDYLQDQLNARNTEVNYLGEHVHSLELKLTDMENLEEKVVRFKKELKRANSERLFLMQQLESKEVELQKSTSCIEKLEESISSVALEYQCEIESMKLDLMALEQSCSEAKRFQEENAQEKARMNGLIQDLELRFQDAQKVIECLVKENKEMREKLETSEMNTRVFHQKMEEQFEERSEDKDKDQLNNQSSSSGLEKDMSNCGDIVGPPISRLALVGASDAGLQDKMEKMSCQIHEYEQLVKQLKEELREEKLKAKEEAEDLAQEMAELRYRITGLLEEECKRRSCIEQISLQRIAELEAQIQKEQRKSSISVRHIHGT
ncbi:hypothetical protein F0562_024854 [Nyssa sinensis]|uniref:C2H2-type domain-containing protein n=1 Tax=Nyssa sinensis TaxID=561372 RepID=A0A5J5BEH7_9ASTE|nr:hypothetical protein F0562_024854 [Nyssa sinensis]